MNSIGTDHTERNARIDPARLAALCPPGLAIEVVEQTGSTNADLLARLPLQGPTLRIAHGQSAGRGRAGRSWLSEPGAALTFSLALELSGPLARLAPLSLAVGVLLAEALGALEVPVQLKWPNDLLKDGSKLAGILIESQGAADGKVWVVIGIGLNLHMPAALEAQIGHAVAAAPWLAQMDRTELMGAIARKLTSGIGSFEGSGFAPFCARWNRLHAWQGLPVRIIDGGTVREEGTAAGVDEAGHLLLDTAAGRRPIVAGDVSLRLGS